jgi:hypothetical protein
MVGFALIMYCEFDGLWLFCSCIMSLMVYGCFCLCIVSLMVYGFALLMYCEFDDLWLVLLL